GSQASSGSSSRSGAAGSSRPSAIRPSISGTVQSTLVSEARTYQVSAVTAGPPGSIAPKQAVCSSTAAAAPGLGPAAIADPTTRNGSTATSLDASTGRIANARTSSRPHPRTPVG